MAETEQTAGRARRTPLQAFWRRAPRASTPCVDINMDVYPGQVVGLMGPSGSGKTTLLHCIACILEPSSGRITLDGEVVYDERWLKSDLRRLRLDKIGFIFQYPNLLPFLDGSDNVAVVLDLAGFSAAAARTRAVELLDYLEVGHRKHALPKQLSGGEAQRVAIARALANKPRIILADEPTAPLDSARARIVMDLLRRIAVDQSAAIIVVTHDEMILDRFDHIFRLRDGRLETESSPHPGIQGGPPELPLSRKGGARLTPRPPRLRSRSLARSPSAGRGSAVNGSGRVTSIAAKPEPRGEQSVEHAFAEPLRQFCRDAMAEHLLDQAVARRHAAGDREMRDDVAHQPDHAERARPSAVEPRQLPDQPQRGHEHEQHVDQGARADRGDDRDALRGRRDQPARLLIERRHQFALGQPDHVGAVDDVVGMALQRGAGPRQMRVLVRELQQIVHDGAAFGAIVAQRAPRRRADAVFRSSRGAPARTLRARSTTASASAAAAAKASPR